MYGYGDFDGPVVAVPGGARRGVTEAVRRLAQAR